LRRLLDALELVRIVAVEDDVRVEVPVTRMEDVRDLEAMTAADLRNPRQDLRQAGPRDRRVLYQQVRCDPPHGAEGLLATLPERRAVVFVDGALHVPGAGVPAAGLGAVRIRIEPGLGSVELDHERGAGIRGVASSIHARLDGAD